ncbi:MAG: DUF2231 domain-containing protein [Bacteroidales bacterium]
MNLIHLHPMLVHFPVALTLVALCFHLADYWFKQEWLNKGAVALVVLATLGAFASLCSGFFFTKPVAGLAASIKEVHIMFASISTVFLVLASIVGLISLWKKNGIPWKYFFTVLLILASIAISLAGMKGGSIVYDVWLF